MLRFAANLSFLFQEAPFLERFDLAAQAGFQGVEFMFPYEWSAIELSSKLKNAGLTQVLFNLPPGNWQAGERGVACIPGREDDFARGLDLALEYAVELGCKRLHAMAGLAPAGVSADRIEATFLSNIAKAAERCAGAGVTLLIEPINSRIDMPGYWLDQPEQAFRLQRLINMPSLKVQLDVYHAAVVGADTLGLVAQHLAQIGHFQVADFPGRHEPGSGSVDFDAFFSAVEESPYEGWIGCEYRPQGSTESSLPWLFPWSRPSSSNA